MRNNNIKVTFFCRVEKKALLLNEFYKQDIDILNDLGFKVVIANKWRAIDWKSDVIYIWWWTYAFLPVFIAKLIRKKVIITGTFNYKCPQAEKDFFRRNILERFLVKYSFDNANVNLIVSSNEFLELKKDWQPTNMVYSPHIVDTNYYTKSDFERRKSNLIFTLSWLSMSNVKRKCIIEIIEAAKLVHSQNQNIQFVIGGRSGNALAFLKTKVKEESLFFINIVGELTLEDKLQYLQECTIYLQPSKYEGFGLAIAEAMSCGAPIISSDVGEVKNVVGDTGILLDTCQPEAISKNILSLVKDNLLREKFSLKAAERIRSNFNYSRRKKDIQSAIRTLL
jgi:glycosyltransferase involved in cell wall biosynthesis